MHLRDGEGGRTTVRPAYTSGNLQHTLLGNPVGPSSTRRLPWSGLFTDYGGGGSPPSLPKNELLLSWLLLLFCSNDESRACVNWGYRRKAGSSTVSEFNHTLTLAQFPAARHNLISAELQAITALNLPEVPGCDTAIYFHKGTRDTGSGQEKEVQSFGRPVVSTSFSLQNIRRKTSLTHSFQPNLTPHSPLSRPTTLPVHAQILEPHTHTPADITSPDPTIYPHSYRYAPRVHPLCIL
jgi:hypothetical protein